MGYEKHNTQTKEAQILADNIRRYGTIIKDIRNEKDNSRLLIIYYNNNTHLLILKNGELQDFFTGNISLDYTLTKTQIIKKLNSLLLPNYTYQTGGGVLKSGEFFGVFIAYEFFLSL